MPVIYVMRFDDLCAIIERSEFPGADAREHPQRQAVASARQSVTEALRDDEFLIDCLALELDLLERRLPRKGLVPFFTLPASGIRFAFGYWPPGRNADAHEHTGWTITAVCRNQLVVQTYDREQSYRQQDLVPKKSFDAPAGRVGFIYEPCIHAPRNPTDRWSLSLHVTSPRDGEKLDENRCLTALDDWTDRLSVNYDDPYTWVMSTRYQQILSRQIAGFLADSTASAAQALRARCRRFAVAHETLSGATTLRRTHAGLVLSCRDFNDSVALGVDRSSGWVEQVRMARLAGDSLAFCASRMAFKVDDLPGRLTDEERRAIAGALAQSGTFRLETA